MAVHRAFYNKVPDFCMLPANIREFGVAENHLIQTKVVF